MYKPTKRVLSIALAASIAIGAITIADTAEAGQSYDSSNVGITGKVEDYIENNTAEDPVAELTNGIVTATATEAEASVTDAEVVEIATENDASPTDAEIYPQFQDRAVAATEGKVNIRTEANTESEVVGVLDRGGICLVDDIGDEWTKIESGTCVGYIKNEFLAYGDDAGEWCLNNGISRRATVNTATLKVREEKDESSDCVTLIPEGEEYYVYSESDEWTELYIDDDIRGFVKSDYVDVVFDTTRAVSVEEQAEMDRKAKEEADAAWLAYLAEQEAAQQAAANTTAGETTNGTAAAGTTVAATDNSSAAPAAAPAPAAPEPAPAPAVQSYAAPAGQTGVDLANYACQFVGNPYVWGGTSLTNGADCSGFTMSVYSQFGYSLPHNAASQSGYGVEVSLSDLQAGDLLFYSNGGGIGHVGIYIGGGSVVHASNPSSGIKISSYNYRTPVKATRIIGQ